MEKVTVLIILNIILSFGNAEMYGCDLCLCDVDSKYIECRGSAIIYWPSFPYFNNSVKYISFLDTSITKLINITENEYNNLTSLFLFDNEYLSCSEIIRFMNDYSNINIYSDNDCSMSTSREINFSLSVSNGIGLNESIFVTQMEMDELIDINNTWIIYATFIFSLGLLGVISGIIIIIRKRRNNTT